jgi:hypothetical protein
MNGKAQPKRGGREGMGVDSRGGPVIDPTENVVALVKADKEGADEIRKLTDRLVSDGMVHLRDMQVLRAEHLKELIILNANHQEKMDAAESARLNSIRLVDAQQVQTAAQAAQTAIQTLANTTTTSAETLRSALATTATTIAAQLQSTVSRLEERISGLEKSSYTGAGRSAVSDPAMEQFMARVERLTQANNIGAGKSEGFNTSWAIVVAAAGIAIALYMAIRPPLQPTVSMVPAPTAQMGQQAPVTVPK